jgi:hypothetical protein
VVVHKIDFISKSIGDLRDEDLQPQLDELVGWYAFSISTAISLRKNMFSMHYNTLYRGV